MIRLLLLSLALVVASFAHMETSSCGVTKKCVFVPSGCQGSDNCRQIFSYSNTGADGWTDLELFSTNDSPANNYVSVGFSNDDIMGDDFVTHCIFPETGTPEAHVSYNFGKSNAPPSEEADLSAEKDHIELVHAHKDNDGMYCQVRQKSNKAGSKFLPDLDKNHSIFLVRGKARNARAVGIHSLDPASPDFPFISDQKLNVGAVNAPKETEGKTDATEEPSAMPNASVSPATEVTTQMAGKEEPWISKQTRFLIIKIHGILMVFAWMFLIALAVLSARYLRDHFPNSNPAGLKWWFHLHRTLNLIAVPFILLATFLVFLAEDWTWQGPTAGSTFDANTAPGAVHSLVGTIAVLVAVANPLMSLLRCAPDTGARPIFNWSHRILGIFGIVCALIAVLIASNSFKGLWSDANWSFSIVLFYIVILLLAVIIFEILTYMKWQPSTKTSDVELRNRGSRYDDRGRAISTSRTAQPKPMMGITALYVVFALFALCAAASLIVMLII